MSQQSYPIMVGYRVWFWFGAQRHESQLTFADVLKVNGGGSCDLQVYPINGGTPMFMRNCQNINDRQWIDSHLNQVNRTGAWDYHPSMPAPGRDNTAKPPFSSSAPLNKQMQGAGK